MKKITKKIMALMLSLVMMLGCIPSFINEASANEISTVADIVATAGNAIPQVTTSGSPIPDEAWASEADWYMYNSNLSEYWNYLMVVYKDKQKGGVSIAMNREVELDGSNYKLKNASTNWEQGTVFHMQDGKLQSIEILGYGTFIAPPYKLTMDNVVAGGSKDDFKLYLDGTEISYTICDENWSEFTEFEANKRYWVTCDFKKNAYKPVQLNKGDNASILYDSDYNGCNGSGNPSGHEYNYDNFETTWFYYCTIYFTVNPVYSVRNTAPETDKETNHGYITISKTSVTGTDQLEVTAYPDEGFKVDQLTCNADNELGMPLGLRYEKNNLTYTFEAGINDNVKIIATFREIVSAVDIDYTPVNAKSLTTQAPNAISLVEPSHLISDFYCFELVRLYDGEGNLLYIYNPVSGEPGNFVYSWLDMNTEVFVDEPVWDNVECAIDFVNLYRKNESPDDFASDTTVTYDNGQQSLTQISEGDVAEGYYFKDDYYEEVYIQMLLPIEAPVPTGGGSSKKYKATDTKDTAEKITGSGKKGSTRTIVPEEGRKVASVKVVDKNGNEVPVTMNEDGTYSFEQPASNVDVLVSYKNREITLNIGSTEASVDGERENLDVCPVIRNDRTMLPIRFVAENLGAKVEWSEKNPNYVVITRGDTKIEISLGSDIMKVNGKDVKLDSVAFAENDRTYLPVRAISEALNAIVEWNENEPSIVRIYERQ